MKTLIFILMLAFSSCLFSQAVVPITGSNQWGRCNGGMQIDSALCFPMKDTLNPFTHFANMRKVGRAYLRPGDFRLYVYDGLKYRPINTFTAILESKLNGIAPGATVNQTDSHLMDRSNHTGVQSYSSITGLSPVSWTGNYVDLIGRPDMSVLMQFSDTLNLSERINLKLSKSDTTNKWRPVSWVPSFSQITSKPSSLLGYGITDAYPLSGNPAGFISSVPAQTWSSLTGKPTTVSGYGITDIYPSQTGNSGRILSTNGSVTSWVIPNTGTVSSMGISSTTLSIAGTNPVTTSGIITINLLNTGTAGTYGNVTTDVQGRVISGKRQQTYSGTTDASGNYTVTFSTSYPSAPNIQVCLINPNLRDTPVPTVTATGFTINVQRRTDVIGLLPTYANVVGAQVDILVTEK